MRERIRTGGCGSAYEDSGRATFAVKPGEWKPTVLSELGEEHAGKRQQQGKAEGREGLVSLKNRGRPH